jgi:hypothetical protein
LVIPSSVEVWTLSKLSKRSPTPRSASNNTTEHGANPARVVVPWMSFLLGIVEGPFPLLVTVLTFWVAKLRLNVFFRSRDKPQDL